MAELYWDERMHWRKAEKGTSIPRDGSNSNTSHDPDHLRANAIVLKGDSNVAPCRRLRGGAEKSNK